MARLSADGERHFVRLLLLKDDWGCFEATPGFIRGHCYPYHNITSLQIITYHNELENNGDLRFWQVEDRYYGLFCTHEKYFNNYGVSDKGEQTRHRRKTPEPPKSIFNKEYNAVFSNHNTSLQIGSIPVPVPALVPVLIKDKNKPREPVGSGFNAYGYFLNQYKNKRGIDYLSTNVKKEAPIVNNIFLKVGEEKFKAAIDRLHASDDKFIVDNRYNVISFNTKIMLLLDDKTAQEAEWKTNV
jgi:hypothetical protein